MTNTTQFLIPRLITVVIAIFISLYAPQSVYAIYYDDACGATEVQSLNSWDCSPNYMTCAPDLMGQYADLKLRECPAGSGNFYLADQPGRCVANATCAGTAPSASINANPTSIVQGNSSVISWTSVNTTSCTSTTFSTGGATRGSVSVSPVATTTYDVTCTGPTGSTGIKSVTVGVTPPVFGASCSANQSLVTTGQTVTWNALAWNGVAPYSFSWIGQIIQGLTGPSVSAVYTTTGTKIGQVQVTDSTVNASGVSLTNNDDKICSGPIIASNITPGMQEDGGLLANAQKEAYSFARGGFLGGVGVFYDPSYAATYAAVKANPQNYCIDVKLSQACNPPSNWGGCNWSFKVNIHQGTGLRDPQASDQGPYVPDTFGQWNQARFFGAVLGTPSTGAQTLTKLCSNSVAVTQAVITATLWANPVSVSQGNSSTLTWSSTNATSCTGTNFNTGGAVSGTIAVTPAADTTYTVTCTGTGSPASSSVTVAVTPAACMLNANKWYTGGTSVLVSNENLNGPDDCAIETAGYPYWNRQVTYDSSKIYPYTTDCYGVTNPTGQISKPKIVYLNGTTVTFDSGSACGAGTCKWKYVDGSDTTDLSGRVFQSCRLPSIQSLPQCAAGLSQASDGTNAPPGPPPACQLGSCEKLRKIGPGCTISTQADLSSGPVAPTTAVAGTPVTLTALATNSGTGPSGSFPVLFEVQTPTDSRESSYVGPLLVDASTVASVNYTFLSAATYQVRACANKNIAGAFIVTESDYSNNCGPWTPIVVSGGVQPDLTVTTPPSGNTSFNAGTAQTYTGSTQNIGGSVATAYPNVLQVLDATGNTSLAYFVATPATVTTPVSGSSAVSGTIPAGSYPFNTPGTYKVRFCANMNNVGSLIIPESDLTNNCGPNNPTGTVTVVVGPAGSPSLSCTVSPTSLPGTGGTATWTVTPSNGATPPYTWTPIGFSGYSVVSPTQVSHVFTSADAGSSYTMHVAASNVSAGIDCTPSIPVGSVCAGSPNGTVTATPNRIRASTPTSVTFSLPSIQNVTTSCILTGPGMATSPAPFTPNSCTVSGSFTTNISIPTQSTYTLTCDGVKTATVNVNVLPNFQEF